jgi:nucleotide-binding universal stress UspA family protein
METIVVGIDGSETSRHALTWAATEARLRRARLRVVHAWFEPFVDGYFAAPAQFERDVIEEAAHECLDKAVASIPSGSPELLVDPLLVHGRAEAVLVHQAENCDLIVVGSRGRGGLKELVLGSVSHSVVHNAACPVIVVR